MDPKRIGGHIRSIRRERQLTLQALADRCGLSKGYLSKLEHGLAQAPIATLMTLAKTLGVSINELFDGRKNGASRAVMTPRTRREQVPPSKDRPYAFERLAVGSSFKLTPYLIHIDGKTEQKKVYQHAGEEIIHLLTGQCRYRVGDEVFTLRKGDTLTFDAQQPHGPIMIEGKSATYLAVFSEE